jgi:hypothetical protein
MATIDSREVKSSRWYQRLGWLLLIWLGSVVSLAVVASVLKLAMYAGHESPLTPKKPEPGSGFLLPPILRSLTTPSRPSPAREGVRSDNVDVECTGLIASRLTPTGICGGWRICKHRRTLWERACSRRRQVRQR